MTRPTDPWANWPGKADRWAFRIIAAIATLLTAVAIIGTAGYICQSLMG